MERHISGFTDSANEAATGVNNLSQQEWIENILFKEFKPLQNNFYENILSLQLTLKYQYF
jgi:hypothetical protein